MDEYKDAIGEDDILIIALYHPKRKDLMESFQYLNEAVGFRVKEGKINLPDTPPVFVEGLTLEEARLKIQDLFEVEESEIFISYKDRLARKVELTGMVQVSDIPVDGKLRLYEAISKARIAPNADLFHSYVSREGEMLPIDLYQLMVKGDLCYNIVLRAGDRIYIAYPALSRVIVMGEVFKPRAIDLPYGTLSLREALVEAGGIPYTGNLDAIQVIRGSFAQPKIYQLSWEHVIHLPNESLLLIPGDTVYVSAKPITEWNRFISQILPTFGGMEASFGAYKLIR